ncbi:chalcone isomerase family protein [Bowmanella sp. Y26]|uniref:chalcone isomerase family protein n=1 Tax=Bowmanella yangjiangensis TaxID=2811230 RepID=UPI001BDD204E|nr:chalcone isomerase family protein [Bowmanella yangjiangensis]MBT1064988.1 chalcone isomerase family protein [Bowmanella yangjiangensis]
MKPIKLSIVLWLTSFSLLASPVSELQLIGQAKLRVWFWDVYESALYSQNGVYQAGDYPQALSITYLRDIKSADLINATREQWQRQGLWSEQAQDWLDQLTAIWPDIRRGDTLVLKVSQEGVSHFYFNNAAIGQIEPPAFANAFLAIWLSNDTEYPELRAQLTGENTP